MKDVGIEFPDGADEARGQADVGGRNRAPDGEAMDAEREGRVDAIQKAIGGGFFDLGGADDPTLWPAAACAPARSQTWRKTPPVGTPRQCTMRSGRGRSACRAQGNNPR